MSYPRLNLVVPMEVVTNVVVANGIGGNRTSVYSYGNLAVEVGAGGRGLLGFEWTQQKDEATGLVSRTYYRQEWPYIGMAYKSGQGTSEATWSDLGLSETMYTFLTVDQATGATVSCADTAAGVKAACLGTAVQPGRRYVVYPSQIDSRSADWDGTTFYALPRSKVRNQNVDLYGNVGTVITDTLSATGAATDYGKTVTNNYAPTDTTNWILGRLLKSTVKSTGPTTPAAVVPGSGGLPAAPAPVLP